MTVTLRDQIAMAALATMLPVSENLMNRRRAIHSLGVEAYQIADAMLDARARGPHAPTEGVKP
jgi:hypothetical protein